MARDQLVFAAFFSAVFIPAMLIYHKPSRHVASVVLNSLANWIDDGAAGSGP